MVLIGLLYEAFSKNMLNFPHHVINVRKQNVSNVRLIYFKHHYSALNLNSLTSTIDLTKLDQLGKTEQKNKNIYTKDKI